MPLSIVRNNITAMQVDAIVNTANPRPLIGDGVDTAIHMAAGPELLEARRKIGDIARGQSAITPAFHLPAKYVIHTVGPIWQDGEHGESETLRRCYESVLKLAEEHGCESVAFPLISAGTYGYPKDQALQTAISAISGFLMHHESMMVYLVVFDSTAYALSEKLFSDVKNYIDENLISDFPSASGAEEATLRSAQQRLRAEQEWEWEANRVCESVCLNLEDIPSLKDLVTRPEESFAAALIRMIGEKGLKNADVYKKANMDRKHFSKILKEDYQPGKNAVMALAIALELNLDETRDFLGRAGYALTRSSKTDIIVQFFIESGNYDIFELEQVLFQFTGKTLINY